MGLICSCILASPFDFHDPICITGGSHEYWIPESDVDSSSLFLGRAWGGLYNAYLHSQKKKKIIGRHFQRKN